MKHKKHKYKTPYAELMPPLSSTEFAALKADIKENGVMHPVLVDEDGNVLDGHNRLEIEPDAPTVVVTGLSDAAKEAYVYGANRKRRNLSPEQEREQHKKMRDVARKLKEEGQTQALIALRLGVAQQTVSDWLNVSNTGRGNANHDCRLKITAPQKEEIVERVESGETHADVAADYKLSRGRVSQIAKAHETTQEKIAERQAKAKQVEVEFGDEEHGVVIGDFREVSKRLADESVDLIFTDPPYDRPSLPLYRDLGAVASRVLKPGGSLITFINSLYVPETIEFVTSEDIRFLWTICCMHTGNKARMTEFGILVNWKPLLWFVKGTKSDHGTFVDDLVVSEPNKEFHEWQQGLPEAEYYIEKLTPEGGVVFDPFCGSGTTAVAAKSLGRTWLTCDIHAEHALIARGRVASIKANKPQLLFIESSTEKE